jgi:biotin transport system permease protein
MSGLFTLYVPGASPLHRLGVGWKYLVVLLLIVPAVVLASPWLSLASLAASALLLLAARLPARYALGMPWGAWLLAALLAGYQLVLGSPGFAVAIAANLVTAIYASRLLTATTPATVLVDALTSALRPLRVLRIDPELVGLAVALMLRSIPVLLDAFGQVRMAARARGRERNPFALVTPVVVRAVGYAHATGAALAARGLDGE